MIRHLWLALAAAITATVPLLPTTKATPPPPAHWPTVFEGRSLAPAPPGPGDAALARDFPGRIARFTDGRRQIVLRRVARATRELHPARDCFRGLGYAIAPLAMRAVENGYASCFEAKRTNATLHVCERVTDAEGHVFADAPSWYWPALLGASPGPWLAAMTVERVG